MSVIKDPASGFDFAYKGFQYPLPPSWKYAIRQQDQINWLLQAILTVNGEGVSAEYLAEQLEAAATALREYADTGDDTTRSMLQNAVSSLEEEIRAINAGLYYTRNPVTGMFSPIYTALKQMYDILRVNAMTWDEIAALGKTWDELKADGHSWFDIDMESNTIYGDGEPRIKFTPDANIDHDTPGYVPAGVGVIGRTWQEIKDFGFLTRKDV